MGRVGNIENHIPRRVVRPYVVFISHSNEEIAIQTKKQIEKYAQRNLPPRLAPLGVKVIVAEREKMVGKALEEKFCKMIQASSCVVALLTSETVSSKWVRWELETARKLDKKILPVVEEDSIREVFGLSAIESPLFNRDNLSWIAEECVKSIYQSILGLHLLKGWRPGVILRNALGISNWQEYEIGMGIKKLQELRTKRKAEDDAWYWLQQQDIDP